jgi:hypothetical protein
VITPPTIDHAETSVGESFTITWQAATIDGTFRCYVRFATPRATRDVVTGKHALPGLAICLGRILDRGFACAPQCSGDLVCLEADSFNLELLQTSMVVELVFADATGPDLRTHQRAFHDGVVAFLAQVLEWTRDQPADQRTGELAGLIDRIRTATTPVVSIRG